MRLITLIAGYAAGLAVAMKYRKDAGTSKLQTPDPTKSRLDAFIDEVVDIHKSAFADVRGLATETFADIENFDDLQTKVSGLVSSFSSHLDTQIARAREAWTIKKTELLQIASDLYTAHQATLESAKSRAASFAGIPEATIDAWISTARQELQWAYTAIESRFATPTVPTPQRAPVKKPVAKKVPVPKTPSV